MRNKFLICVCLCAVSWVSGEKNVSSIEVPLDVLAPRPDPKPLVAEKPTQPMRMNVPPVLQKDETTNTEVTAEIPAMKPLQVTGFITANGSIYEVQDKNGMGQIEARQNGELLTPQAGEFICNYGSVVLYSDVPCEQVAEVQKPATMNMKEHKETLEEPVKKVEETSALDIQADDNSNVVEHKENDSRVGETVGNANNRKTSKNPSRKRGNKKNKKQRKRQNQNKNNKKKFLVTRRRYKIKKPQALVEQAAVQQPQPQPQQQQQPQPQQQQQDIRKQNQKRQQTNNNRRRQQQQKRRLQQLRQQQRRRLQQQQNAGIFEVNNKQRYVTADGLVYEIIDVNEN